MKLVDILARDLIEWPEIAEGFGQYMVQEGDGEIYITCDVPPEYRGGQAWYPYDYNSASYPDPKIAFELADDWQAAIVTRAQWQAAVEALRNPLPPLKNPLPMPNVVHPKQKSNNDLNRSNDDLAVLVASKTFYRFGNLFWGDSIRRKDLVGKLAGSINPSDGYRYVKCGKSRKRVAVHRVVFLMHHGYIPQVIDHINRLRDDNRIEKLRDAGTEGNNQANQSHQQGRSSAYKGVCWDNARGKWSAYVKKDGSRFNLGRFSCEHQAAMAYNSKASELFGEFANLNAIRTPEQIVAEEREAAIKEMCAYGVDAGDSTIDMTCSALFDAGYRKQEQPK